MFKPVFKSCIPKSMLMLGMLVFCIPFSLLAPSVFGVEKQSADSPLQHMVRQSLAHYLRNPKNLQIDIQPSSFSEINQGQITRLHLRALNGEMGDFKYNGLALPFVKADLTVHHLKVDPVKLQAGVFEPLSADSIVVNDIELHAKAINQALAGHSGHLQNIRVAFRKGTLQAFKLGKVKARMDLELKVVPDPKVPDSDTIWVEIKSSSVSRVPVPKKLMQWGIEFCNPLLLTEQIQARLELGSIVMDKDVFRMRRK